LTQRQHWILHNSSEEKEFLKITHDTVTPFDGTFTGELQARAIRSSREGSGS
jgi:hypothetical protein